MPRPRRASPTGQISLFKPTTDAVQQNSRWIATAIATIRQLIKATSRAPDEHYGQQTDTQRPLHKRHCEALVKYYRDTPHWIIAPFVFTANTEHLNVDNGKFTDLDGTFNVLDGQHRIQALHILENELTYSQSPDDKQKLESLLDTHVTLQFIENKGPSDAAQLFVDLNKGKSVTGAELAALDNRDPIVNVIKEALQEVSWADQRTDRSRSRPLASDHYIWTLTTLKTVVKALEVGIKASMPRARREYLATDHGKQESKETLIKFLHWLPTARPEYENLTDNEDLNTPDERTRHYAYENNLIVLLADAWKNSGGTDTQAHLADTIQKFNLNRADAANTLKKDLRLIDDRDHMYGFTRAKYPEASVRIRELAQAR